MVEAMKRAYADRACFLGDPDAVNVPVARLTSKRLRRANGAPPSIRRTRRRRATSMPARAVSNEGRNTTHFSVDRPLRQRRLQYLHAQFQLRRRSGRGRHRRAAQQRARRLRRQGRRAERLRPARRRANAPGPGKRPLSSMTPTIVLKDGKPFLVTGSPGGSRIINAVLQVVTNVIDRGMDIAGAVSAPRVHNQWMPDQVFAETGISRRPCRGAEGARRRPSSCSVCRRPPIRSWSHPQASSAPPTRGPAARWRRDIRRRPENSRMAGSSPAMTNRTWHEARCSFSPHAGRRPG